MIENKVAIDIIFTDWCSEILKKSTLIRNRWEVKLLRQGMPEKKRFNVELLMRGSRDGFRALDFHRLCDNKGPTLTIVQSSLGKVFGGYTSLAWKSVSENQFERDKESFIFSMSN